MATYVVTVVDGEELNAAPAPDARKVLIGLAAAIYGEDVAGHCMFLPYVDPITGDDVAHHHRLGLTVRRVP